MKKICSLFVVVLLFNFVLVPQYSNIYALKQNDIKLNTNDLSEIKVYAIKENEKENVNANVDLIEPNGNISQLQLNAFPLNNYGSKYGYNKLDTQNKKNSYNALLQAATKFTTSDTNITSKDSNDMYKAIAVDISSYNISKDDILKIYLSFYYDNPQIYWLDGVIYSYNTSNIVTTVYLATNEDYKDGETRISLNSQIDNSINNYLNMVSNISSDFDKEVILHDALIYNLDYAYNSYGQPETKAFAHNIVGVFDNDTKTMPVCEGYAKSFQLLLNACDIECIFVGGIGYVDDSGDGGGHAWNQVKLENQWYNVDVTWDDPTVRGKEPPYQTPYYTYFNNTDDNFRDHVPFSSSSNDNSWCYDVNKCSATKYSYNNQKEHIVQLKNNMNNMFKIIYNSPSTIKIYVYDDKEQEIKSQSTVLSETKLKIKILAKDDNLSSSYSLMANNENLAFVKSSTQADENGYYTYTANYTVKKENIIFKLKSKLNIKGDVDQNGIVDMLDVQMALEGVVKKNLTEEEKTLANVIPGDFDMLDVNKLLQYVVKKLPSLD